MSDLREAFEAWWCQSTEVAPERRGEGYEGVQANVAWHAWQSALSANGGGKLTAPALVGNVTFQAGVSFETLIKKAQRDYEFKEQNDIAAPFTQEQKEAILQNLKSVSAPPSVGVSSEVTPEMIKAAEQVDDLYRRGTPEVWADVFRAMLTAAPSPDHIPDAGKVVASSWKSAKTGQHWPHIGGKYLIKLNGVLQHEIYEFDQGDDGMGSGEYFWDREDLDEAAPFNPEKDEWLPIDEAGTATPSVPENEVEFLQRLEGDMIQERMKQNPGGDDLDPIGAAIVTIRHRIARLRTAGDEGEEIHG